MAETKTDPKLDDQPVDVQAAAELSDEDKQAIKDSQVPPSPETGKPTEVKKGDDAIDEGLPPVPVTTSVRRARSDDEKEAKKEYPLAASNGSFYVTLDDNANGIPTVSVLPRGWVGAAPLQIAETELKDLINALTKLKR